MFYITISNGLLKGDHRKRMGSAIWEFMWLIDKVTKIDDEGLGWVLGGKPIKLKDIADDTGVIEPTVSENLTKLENEGYIKKIIAPHGISIRVIKAKKRFSGNPKPLTKEVYGKTETTFGKTETTHSENPKPNKTVSVRDNTVDNIISPKGDTGLPVASYGNKDINELIELLKQHSPLLDGSEKENRNYCWLLLQKVGYKTDPIKAVNGVRAVIAAAAQSDFHSKNLTGYRYLFKHAAAIVADYKNKKSDKVHIMPV